MISMQIKLDRKKIEEDEYDFEEIQKVVDERFKKACKKQHIGDGSILYSGIEGKDYYTELCVAFLNLRKQEWFGKYCCCWKWLETDKKGNEYEEDLLKKECLKNPFFFKFRGGVYEDRK